MATLVKMNISAIGGTIQTGFSGVLAADAAGNVTVDSRDALDILRAGGIFVNNVNIWYPLTPAPAAGVVGRIVASATLANGSATIANQPDYPRMISFRVDPTTGTITAGQAAISYIANDGTVTTDVLSLVTAATVLSQNTSKGVSHVNSIVVSGLVGGASPVMQSDTLNIFGLPVSPGFQSFAIVKANVDGADTGWVVSAAQAAGGCVQPSTAPNGTHTYGFQATFLVADI
jgi:hypothetical protein